MAGIPKGTRDFSPEQVKKRNYIFDIAKSVFKKYGFEPIETPTMENLSTLTGKYGEEGDKLLFKVLNNGDFLAKADEEALRTKNSSKITSSISKRGLRYDLTVPFARYVVQHRNEINLPFKRYQIQPVWRADRPQKGRYQEFYQCDADVVGSDSLMYESEMIALLDEVFNRLNLNVNIHVNNRKILEGIAEACGLKEQFVDVTVSIDKLDKVGLDGVKRELIQRGISDQKADNILSFLEIKSLEELAPKLTNSEVGMKGVSELQEVFEYIVLPDGTLPCIFDITLARGLSYYTGYISEVRSTDYKIGSLSGGGRYDNLTGAFGLKGTSGIGISLGAARIYDVMEAQNLFPNEKLDSLAVLLIAFNKDNHKFAFQQLTKLRAAGISCDLYPSPTKLKKQMKYANDRKVPHVILIGDDEMDSGMLTLKNMESGNQEKLTLENIIRLLSN